MCSGDLLVYRLEVDVVGQLFNLRCMHIRLIVERLDSVVQEAEPDDEAAAPAAVKRDANVVCSVSRLLFSFEYLVDVCSVH